MKETGYAYVDGNGILHVISATASNLTDAVNRAAGIVKEVDIEFSGGYPMVDKKQVVVYGLHECYVNANRTGGAVRKDTEREFPELARIYRELL